MDSSAYRRQVDGVWHLTLAGVLRHPHVDEYAIPVTPPLVHLVRSGALLLDEPVVLGPEWGGALPVPLTVLNHDPVAVRLYEQAFGIPGIVDASGALLESPMNGAVVEAAQDVVARLVRDLAAQPTDLYSMDPRAFEALIAHLLHRDGYEVHLTPASGDGGVDVLAVRSARVGRFLLGVQCKRYAPDRKIGVDVIRELVGTLDLEDLAAGAIVTTSFFTSGARELADRRRTKLTLQDFDDVRRWLLEHVAQR